MKGVLWGEIIKAHLRELIDYARLVKRIAISLKTQQLSGVQISPLSRLNRKTRQAMRTRLYRGNFDKVGHFLGKTYLPTNIELSCLKSLKRGFYEI